MFALPIENTAGSAEVGSSIITNQIYKTEFCPAYIPQVELIMQRASAHNANKIPSKHSCYNI